MFPRGCGYGTTEATYIAQARQTVLAGAHQSLLFCYGSLLQDTGPKNIEALRAAVPELLRAAGEVRKRQVVGVAAYNRIRFYLFQDGSWVLENFTDEAVKAEINGQVQNVPARGWAQHWK